MTLVFVGALIFFLTIIFIYWRTPWSRGLLSARVINQWLQFDLCLKSELPEPILEATFEGCKIDQEADNFYFEVNGSKPVKLSLDDSASHWLRSHNIPEMLAMYGLQYAAWCLRRYTETSDSRWLGKFDRALEVAESEAYRGLKNTFFPWTEHAVALRMVSSRYCLYIIARSLEKSRSDSQMDSRYERVLKIHLSAARLCIQPLLYDFITNHGLITDSSLLQCALTWPEDHALTKKVLKVVSQRAEKAVVYFVSADGVPLEPATSYWYLIRRLLNDIKNALEIKNIRLSDIFLLRLRALDSFLATTNMNGLVQRFGDSACGHQIDLPFTTPPRQEGATLTIYTTGIILMNVVQAGKVVMQFMVNAQDIFPRVHAQEDSGALALYARGNFWINSPGSYTAMNLAKRKVYTHYSNQSTVWHNSRPQNSCKVQSVKTEQDSFIITLSIGVNIERCITIFRKGVSIQITDRTNDRSNLTVGLLLSPGCAVRIEDEGFTLLHDGKELPVMSRTAITESKGYISYRRNEVVETKYLRRSASTVDTKIQLPEFNNVEVYLTQPCQLAPRYIRQFSFMGHLAQIVRCISVRKVQLVLLVTAVCAILNLVTKNINQ